MNASRCRSLRLAYVPSRCKHRLAVDENVRRKAGEDDSVPQPDPIYSDEAAGRACA